MNFSSFAIFPRLFFSSPFSVSLSTFVFLPPFKLFSLLASFRLLSANIFVGVFHFCRLRSLSVASTSVGLLSASSCAGDRLDMSSNIYRFFSMSRRRNQTSRNLRNFPHFFISLGNVGKMRVLTE